MGCTSIAQASACADVQPGSGYRYGLSVDFFNFNFMKPRKPWDGAHGEDMRLLLPAHFIMLCKLTDADPQKVITDFMNTLSMESFGKEKSAQDALQNYFIHCGYGQEQYTVEDLHRIFSDLRAFGQLWPEDAKMKVIDKHSAWRSVYHKYWFKKWWKKYRRK